MTKEKANRNEVVGMFLTYCRKTLVNARTDVLRERKRRRNREAQRSRQSSCSPILPDGRIGVSVRTWGSHAPRCRTVAPVRSPVLRTF